MLCTTSWLRLNGSFVYLWTSGPRTYPQNYSLGKAVYMSSIWSSLAVGPFGVKTEGTTGYDVVSPPLGRWLNWTYAHKERKHFALSSEKFPGLLCSIQSRRKQGLFILVGRFAGEFAKTDNYQLITLSKCRANHRLIQNWMRKFLLKASKFATN